MTADELVAQGRLDAAIASLGEDARTRPRDPAVRLALLATLGFAGDWERAAKQLDVLQWLGLPRGLDLGRIRTLLAAEQQRSRVFEGGPPPRTLDRPGEVVMGTLHACRRLTDGDPGGAADALASLDEGRMPIRGTISGEVFEDIVEADDLLRHVVELFTVDGYTWVAWESIQYLAVSPRADLLDVLWPGVQIATHSGWIGRAVLPGLYPETARHHDDLVRLGRKTEWDEAGAGIVRGAGAKLYAIDGEPRSIWELSELILDPPADCADPAARRGDSPESP